MWDSFHLMHMNLGLSISEQKVQAPSTATGHLANAINGVYGV